MGEHTAEYYRNHAKVYKERGVPWNHLCVSCDRQAECWAQIHDSDPEDVWNYQTRCYSCHNKYDWYLGDRARLQSERMLGNQNAVGHNTKYNEEIVKQVRDMYATGKWTYKDLSYIFDIPKPTIQQIMSYRTWRHVL